MKKERFLLALDCGSTHFKVAVFDSALRRLGDRMESLRYTVRVPKRVEFEPDVAWRMVVRLVREACAQAGMRSEGVCLLALTSQANTFCALDASGQPLIPFMSWQDQRATLEAALLNRRLGADFHQHCSWPRAVPGLQASMLLWLRLHCPRVLEKIASVVTLPGYLALRLGAPNVIDPNLASLSGLYSLQAGRWWPAMLKLCGLDQRQMPKLVPIGKNVVGAVPCRDLIFASRAGVALAGNDQSAGAFGNFCSPKTILVTLGTALVVYRVMRRRGPYSGTGCWGPYPGGGYFELATRNRGCAALDWARARLATGRDIADFTTLARKAYLRRQGQPPDAPESLFYPEAINTEKAWTGSSDPGERALSVFEGIGFALKRLIADDLRVRAPLPEIRVTGGGSANQFWLQLLADILGVRVGRAAGDALDGAARMACPHAAAAAERMRDNIVWFEPRNVRAQATLYQRWLKEHPFAARPKEG